MSLLQRQTPKTPALGFVWTTQIACRIALKKNESGDFVGDYENATSIQGHAPGVSEASQNEGPPPSTEPDPDPTPTTTTEDNPEIDDTTTDPAQKQISEPEPKPQPPISTPKPPPVPELKLMEKPLKRTMKLVFAPWTAVSTADNDIRDSIRDEVEFEIWTGGLRSVHSRQSEE